MPNTGGYGGGTDYTNTTPSGGPLPGTQTPSRGGATQQRSGVAAGTAKDTVIIGRGQPGVPAATRRRLPAEDQKGLGPGPDTTSTISALMDEAYHEDGPTMTGRQKNLVAAGLLDPNGYLPGVFDPPTAKAYQTLLTEASFSDQTPDEVQARRIASLRSIGGPTSGTKRQPLVIDYTNPQDILAGIDKLAPDAIGHGLSPAQAGQLVDAYHAMETSHQSAQYNANDKTGTSSVSPPSLAAFLEQELQSRYPVDYQAMQIANNVGALMKMIGGGPTGG